MSSRSSAERRPDPRPVPEPDDTSRFFWDGATQGCLLLQRCARCSRFQYPPEIACVHCQALELAPTAVSGRGTLYSFTVVERTFHAAFAGRLPYVIGLVELDEQAGLRMMTNIIDAAPDELQIGMPVEVTFEDRGETVLPQFRPADRA